MPCYNPWKAIPIGINADTGKTKYAISKLTDNDDLSQCVIIPCGQCIGCRLDYARQWADRCMLEAKDHESNYFLTLTYDDEHLDSIKRFYADPDTGEAIECLSLNKRDFQLWHKSLRKALDDKFYPKIRFFGCGEYGSQTFRPHFHEIVFGLMLDDLKFYNYNKQGQKLYTSEFLNKIWKKGFIIVGEVSWETCSYVARYVTKKLKGESKEFYDLHNIEPPFSVMSRKPGIGRKYYDDNPGLFDFSYVSLSTGDGSRKVFPPRYFKSLLEVDDPDTFCDLKKMNMLHSDAQREAKLSMTDKTYLEDLKSDEMIFKNRIKSLKRIDV